ncbi:transcription termination factor Rho [Actinomyces sp. S6-Spd3]|uniref:transcription termination factor Rho n=2 Tax=Actinomyces TaxID=1654 RepID=UPI00050E8A04|nr:MULTISPECIES: transcription termination factor Rho [unclassified Actinomyces]KGE99258.1 transcription termination factor Rho [Actinomyces sp. S6-Spd3]MDU1430984.1 transcription termination factor Rho [Actinomyces sp.]
MSNDVTTQERELSRLKLVELKAMATELGLKGVSAMRKPQLIEAISTAQSNSSPEASAPRRRRAEREEASEAPQVSIELPEASVQESASEERSSREASLPRKSRRRRVVSSEAAEPPTVTLDLPAPAQREEEESAPSQHIEISLPDSDDPESRERSRRDREGRRRGRGREGRESRRERGDRGERGERREAAAQASASEENLAPIAGILDVQENHAFVRTSGYLPGPNDVYVTLGNVRRWGLRPGDAVAGAVRQPREGERQRQKYNALVRVDSVNGMSIEDAQARREFSKLTPIYPDQQLRMETSAKAYTPRVIDLVAPIGKGQRGLIVSPPKAGKTMVIQQIAKAIELNNPEVHLMVVLVDERPEEVTDMRSIVKGEVIASTFDRPASDHAIVAELAIERAKRLVELGQDVVVLLDSITRLSRAYNLAAPASGRILSGGVDASALYPPKKFFGGARNLREGGSLTIIASALVETGSKMDEVIFEEFKGTGNMELRLSRQLADRRIFPAIDINASGTRREEMLLKPEELRIMWKLRRVLGTLDQQSALEAVLDRLKETQSNAEFLMLVQKQVPSAD